jgi:uncharacterized protein (DUF2141 family)
MKHLILSIAITLTSLLSFAQDGVTITVSIDNVSNDKGSVGFALHSKDTFMKAAPIEAIDTAIKDGKVLVTFKNVMPGNYAVLALHDANSNGNMDFSENGMPLESYGVSNNVMDFGPPNFEDSKFEVYDKDLEIKIRF